MDNFREVMDALDEAEKNLIDNLSEARKLVIELESQRLRQATKHEAIIQKLLDEVTHQRDLKIKEGVRIEGYLLGYYDGAIGRLTAAVKALKGEDEGP